MATVGGSILNRLVIGTAAKGMSMTLDTLDEKDC